MTDLGAVLAASPPLGPLGPTTSERPPATPCTSCAGRGYYIPAVPYGHPDFGRLTMCDCRRRAHERAAQQRRAALLAALDDELGELAACRLDRFDPDRPLEPLAGRTLDGQRKDLQAALSAVLRYVDQPRGWMFLMGPCGSGKSHLAAGVAHDLAAHGMLVKYASVPLFLDFIKRGFRDDSADDRVTALQDVDVLVLDDLGTEQRTKWNDEALFKIVHARYLRTLPTILTSNVRLDELEPRIASRIEGCAQIVRLVASDYRKEQRKQREARGP